MRLEFDPEVDCAYLTLADRIPPGGVERSIPVESNPDGVEFLLDVDAAGCLVGVEIIGATRGLHPEVLAGARPYKDEGRRGDVGRS